MAEADEDLITKVSAHEWFHWRQQKLWKYMPWHWFREKEAEKRALEFAYNGNFVDIPRISNPLESVDDISEAWRRDRAMAKASGYSYVRASTFRCRMVRNDREGMLKPRCGCGCNS